MVVPFWLLVGLSTSLVANLSLPAYILLKKIKSPAAFYYFWFMIAVSLHVAGDLFFQLATTPGTAEISLKAYWAGYILLASLFFLFATNFPRSRKFIFEDEKSKLAILIIPLILMYLLLFSPDFIQKIVLSDSWVNYAEYGSIYWIAVLYLLVFLVLAFSSLLSEYFKSKIESEKRNILLIFLGVFIATILGWPTDVLIFKAIGFGELKITSLLIFFGCVIISYVVVQHKVFLIKPVSEEIIVTKQIFSGDPGKIYSFDEKNEIRRRAFRFFADQVKHNRQGLLVSTKYPDQIRKTYNLPKTPIVWISDSAEIKKEKVSPKELDVLITSIHSFVEKATSPVVLIEGIKQLVIENGSTKVVEFLNTISSQTKETNATVFFSLKGEEVTFFELFNEINSLKTSISDLNEKYFSRNISENAYLDLLRELEEGILEKEAEFKLMEDFLLGKINTVDGKDRKKLILEKSIQIISYKLGKRTLDIRVAEPLKNSLEKELVKTDQELKKKNIIEKY